MHSSKDHWFARFTTVQAKNLPASFQAEKDDIIKKIHHHVSLLSLAKQMKCASFLQIYHYFFKCPFTSNAKTLSVIYRHFIKIIVVYAIGLYKMECIKKKEFISQILNLLKITNILLQQLTTKFIDFYLEHQYDLFRRIFQAKINKQLSSLITQILNEEFSAIPLDNCEYFAEQQSEVLPIFYVELVKNTKTEENKSMISQAIKQFIQNNVKKLQQAVKIFPHQRAINYKNFLKKQAQYFTIKEVYEKQRKEKKQPQNVDEFYILNQSSGLTLHELINDERSHYKQMTIQQKIDVFVRIVKEAEVYKQKTGLYYPYIDTSIINNEAESKCEFTIEKPLLFHLGLFNPEPKTVQMEMSSSTPQGFLYQPLFSSPEQLLKNWSFEKHLFVSEIGDERKEIEADQEQSHVYRLLLIGHQILSGQNMLNTSLHLSSATNPQRSVEDIIQLMKHRVKKDGFNIQQFLPGIELTRELKSLKFDFSFKKLLELVQIIKDEYSLIKPVRFNQIYKIEHLRILLIKRAVFFLSHNIYFKRLFNTKKYVIIFFLACVEYMHLLFLLVLAQEYRPKGSNQLEEIIRQLIITIIKPAKRQNYIEMAYKKIFLDYNNRQDNQKNYMTRIQSILKSMSQTKKAVDHLKKIDQQIVALKRQGKIISSQHRRIKLNQKMGEMRPIIMKYYGLCVTILSQFIHHELFKHRYQIERFHKLLENKNQISLEAPAQRLLYESLTTKLYLTIKVFLKLCSSNFASMECFVLPFLFSKTAHRASSLQMKRTLEIQAIDEQSMESKQLKIVLQRLNTANEVLDQYEYYRLQQFETPINKYDPVKLQPISPPLIWIKQSNRSNKLQEPIDLFQCDDNDLFWKNLYIQGWGY